MLTVTIANIIAASLGMKKFEEMKRHKKKNGIEDENIQLASGK